MNQESCHDSFGAVAGRGLYPFNRDAQSEEQSITRFFQSDWFKVLTNLDPEALINRLNKEVAV